MSHPLIWRGRKNTPAKSINSKRESLVSRKIACMKHWKVWLIWLPAPCSLAFCVGLLIDFVGLLCTALEGVEVVFHMAAPNSSINNYKLHYSVNVQGTLVHFVSFPFHFQFHLFLC